MSGVRHGQTFLPYVRSFSTWDYHFALKRGKILLNSNMKKIYVEANQAQKQQECLVQDSKIKEARDIRSKAISLLDSNSLNKKPNVFSFDYDRQYGIFG